MAADEPPLEEAIAALDNPHRLRIIAELNGGRQYVSELARRLGLSRALLYLHLDKLEAGKLVTSALEIAPDGKSNKFYELRPFELRINATLITKHVGKGKKP